MNTCTDFLLTVLKGHLVASACLVLQISKPDEIPENIPTLSDRKSKLAFIAKISRQVVGKCSIVSEAMLRQQVTPTTDGVYDARVLCHHASLVYEFRDALAEGDGERICRCWKVLLMHFYNAQRTKYAWEALKLQFQLAVLPPSLSHQVKWGRFFNTHGGPGRNIPCDLFNEHLNKLFKDVIQNMGSNITDEAVKRAARSVTGLRNIRDAFDADTKVSPQTTAHSTKDEVAKVVSVILNNDILLIKKGRKHSSYSNIKSDPFSGLNYDHMFKWIERKQTELIQLKIATGEGELSESEDEYGAQTMTKVM